MVVMMMMMSCKRKPHHRCRPSLVFTKLFWASLQICPGFEPECGSDYSSRLRPPPFFFCVFVTTLSDVCHCVPVCGRPVGARARRVKNPRSSVACARHTRCIPSKLHLAATTTHQQPTSPSTHASMQRALVNLPPMLPYDTMDVLMQVKPCAPSPALSPPTPPPLPLSPINLARRSTTLAPLLYGRTCKRLHRRACAALCPCCTGRRALTTRLRGKGWLQSSASEPCACHYMRMLLLLCPMHSLDPGPTCTGVGTRPIAQTPSPPVHSLQ
jgi:hypothetical protein